LQRLGLSHFERFRKPGIDFALAMGTS